VASHHDHLFQLVFADPKHAVPLLRSALPASIHQIINWSTLTRIRATQRGRRGKKTICDVVDLENTPAELHPFLPSCRYFLDDLQQEEPEQLHQRRMTI
jgi:hypothetical protein